MRRCAALLLLVSASLPGCSLTRRVWQGAITREVPGTVDEVVVSPKGDVSLRYSAQLLEVHWGIGLFGGLVVDGGGIRVILVPRSDMERLLARKRTGAIPEVSGEELRTFLLSSSGLSGTPDGARVKSSQEADHAVVFAYPRLSRDGQGGESRRGEEETVRFHLPKGTTGKPPSLAVRALLVPPAAIADATVDVVTVAAVIVTAPVWVPMKLLGLAIERKGHGFIPSG